MAKKNPETIFIELCDKRSSGFILAGTENTLAPEELNCPTVRWIPNEGMMADMSTGVRRDVRIRFINGCDSILVEEQDKRGFKPNRYEDKITLEKGYATVVKEGSTVGLFEYLTKVYYNEDAPNRSESAAKLFKLVKLDQEAEGYNEQEVIRAHAIIFVDKLAVKTGKDTYQYNEDRIDSLCNLLGLVADTPATKMFKLMQRAKGDPKSFMQTVEKFEQTIVTEISHALDLNVIKFDDNTAIYTNENKVIKNLGTQKLKKEDKVEGLADYLKTRDGNEALTELRAKLDLAKENALRK